MLKKLYRLTQDGINELQKELEQLVANRRVIADQMKTARESGDLTGNAEYQAAQIEQERNESRISEIESILHNVDKITSLHAGGKAVQFGSRVKLKNTDGRSKAFQVVGTVEADPLKGRISDESPIGQSLLGKKIGERVEIKTPTETNIYEVVEIA